MQQPIRESYEDKYMKTYEELVNAKSEIRKLNDKISDYQIALGDEKEKRKTDARNFKDEIAREKASQGAGWFGLTILMVIVSVVCTLLINGCTASEDHYVFSNSSRVYKIETYDKKNDCYYIGNHVYIIAGKHIMNVGDTIKIQK